MTRTIVGLSVVVIMATSGLAGAFTPGNLAVLSADNAAAKNTTCTILELEPSVANQSAPVSSTAIGGSGTNALRVSGSASSTGYLTRSGDRSLLAFTGVNNSDTSANVNTLNPRGIGTLDVYGNFALQTTYTGGSGNQTRGATTLDNAAWFVGDQGGIYTNGATSANPSGNIRSIKAFNGTVYAFQASAAAAPVSTLSGGTLTALPGLPSGATSMQDFYLISSGSNGSTCDVLYVLQAASASAGTIYKYSLVGGSWTANGSSATAFGGFGLAAATNDDGTVALYMTSGTGATAANTVQTLTDSAGYNATIALGAPTTLFTAAGGTTLKGIDFVPTILVTTPTTQASNVTFGSVQQMQMHVSWTNGDGAFRLVVCCQGSAPSGGPTDGTNYTANSNFAGGGDSFGGGKVVYKGSGSSFTLTGLQAGTNYYLQVYEFNGNGATTKYLTGPATGNPNSRTTLIPAGDTDSRAVAPGSQVPAGDVSSLATTAGGAVDVFSFTLQDSGAADSYGTKVTQLTVKPASENTAGWAASLQGVKLYNISDAASVTIGTPSIADASIVIPIASGNLTVPNGASKSIRLSVYLRTNAIADNAILQFRIDSAAPGFTTDPANSSGFAPTFPADVTGNALTLRVVATKLAFVAVPSIVTVGQTFSATVQALDANNNADVDSTVPVTISIATGSGTLAGGGAQNLAAGQFTYDALRLNAAGTNTLQAAGGTLTGATSGNLIVLPPSSAGNLAVLRADTLGNNTTCTILELDPSAANQSSPVSSTAISGSGPNALRISGSAASTGYLTRNADRSLLAFTGANTNDTAANVNTYLTRGVGTLDASRNFVLQTAYSGSAGNQTRGATSLDNTNWFIGDQNGLYTNQATAKNLSGNFRAVKSFGGIVYAFQASASLASVFALSPVDGTLAALPGLPPGSTSMQDFYLIASGSNGATCDVLYVLESASASTGTVYKYSLAGGSWAANGAGATTVGGFGLAAATNGDGTATLYVTSGTGATPANSVQRLTDSTGYNAAIGLGAPTALYTAPAGTTLKGIDFVPTALVSQPAPTIGIAGPAMVQWPSVAGCCYRLERSANLLSRPAFDVIVRTNIPATPPLNTETDATATGPGPYFYRVGVE